jgi:indolepyruvate ferredoxin oxidoreductase alpha subunit
VESVRVVDAYDYQGTLNVIKEEISREEPSVILTDRPCVLMPKRIRDKPYTVDLVLCNGCSACFKIGCPAILKSEELTGRKKPKAEIDTAQCTGCTLCVQICKPEAIIPAENPVKTGPIDNG